MNNFKLMPKFNPDLEKHIQSAILDFTEKLIKIEIEENDTEVYEWIEHIKKIQDDAKDGPFVNLEDNSIIMNYNGINITFNKLFIKEHKFILKSRTHQLTIEYGTKEMDVGSNNKPT